ncbi:MAG: glycosyltransferase family 9 protein, partial [Lentisphaerae bacterium]|nr:glycosyltransferase family 9 protein [Lentisphaerota bacterium]
PVVTSSHAADHFLRPVIALGIAPASAAAPLLPWPEAQREQARHWLKSQGLKAEVISLHPGSGSPRKNWPIEKFVSLADQVRRAFSVQPIFILGEAETQAARALAPLVQTYPMLINRSLKEVASVLAVSRGYVGNDSGITHLAAALGIPVVALFGATAADVWGPRGANVVILQGHPPTAEALAAIAPAAVLQALTHSMAK